jgi:hypothetical protein
MRMLCPRTSFWGPEYYLYGSDRRLAASSDYVFCYLGFGGPDIGPLTQNGRYVIELRPYQAGTGVFTITLTPLSASASQPALAERDGANVVVAHMSPATLGGAKVLAKAESPAPAQQGGTAWEQLIAQLNNEAAQPGNRIEVTKYYAFGGARIAMRQAGNEVFYLAGDHLGSASLVLDWQGRKISEMRYTPWGETRWAWELDGEGYTDKRFASHST